MTDFRLMRGEGWVRCCICGALHEDPYPNLFVDDDDERWDFCRGDCAVACGYPAC